MKAGARDVLTEICNPPSCACKQPFRFPPKSADRRYLTEQRLPQKASVQSNG
jgi:hypothetical protein